MKLVAHSDYVSKILEEIIIFDTQTSTLLASVALIEEYQLDFQKIINMWKNQELAIKEYRIEEFSEAKLLYLGLLTMKAL